MTCRRLTSTGDVRVTSTGDTRVISADICSPIVAGICNRITSTGDRRVTSSGDVRVLSADICSPVTPVAATQGGGRVLVRGQFPDFWKDWEEPQPKVGPPEKSSKEEIAELAAELRMPEPAKILPFAPKAVPKPKPAVIERSAFIEWRAVLTERQMTVMLTGRLETKHRTISSEMRTQRRMLAAALLLLMDDE